MRQVSIAVVALLFGLWPASLATPDSFVSVTASPQVAAAGDLWLVPPGGTSQSQLPALGAAAADLAAGRTDGALAAFARGASHPVLGAYARLYQGRAELALERHAAALASARHVISSSPGGALGEAALWLLADAAEAAGRTEDTMQALEALAGLPAGSPARVHLRLGRAAVAAGDRARAARAFATVYYEHAASPEAAAADAELRRLTSASVAVTSAVELSRAEQLFTARRYADARKEYDRLIDRVPVGDRPLVALRQAQCELHLGRHGAARAALRAELDRGTPLQVEAEYAHLTAVRGLRREADYVALVRGFVEAYPGNRLAETALNELATYYILADEDAKAVGVFEDMLQRFPSGTFADRAAWRAGWWAYRHGDFEKSAKIFEAAAIAFPRADYRPSWLYWSARSHERLRRPDAALAAYQRTIASYRNSYYGRQAATRAEAVVARLGGIAKAPVAFRTGPAPVKIAGGRQPLEPAKTLVVALLGAGLYDDAVAELRAAAREQGSSPFIEATIAWALNRKGDLRPAITAMRRAYPEFMAAGGETLPIDLLKIIFPLEHWDLLRRHAALRDLDPYLVAALVAQESTFQADVRSIANAWGLMQIIPATGRRYAARLGIPRFTTRRLTDPDVNVQIGTSYLADLVSRFGSVPQALAAYNAGENRVERWRGERPELEPDEFVDDIPFPETQNYVKRVIGTAEDYRTLYGTAGTAAMRESGR